MELNRAFKRTTAQKVGVESRSQKNTCKERKKKKAKLDRVLVTKEPPVTLSCPRKLGPAASVAMRLACGQTSGNFLTRHRFDFWHACRLQLQSLRSRFAQSCAVQKFPISLHATTIEVTYQHVRHMNFALFTNVFGRRNQRNRTVHNRQRIWSKKPKEPSCTCVRSCVGSWAEDMFWPTRNKVAQVTEPTTSQIPLVYNKKAPDI